LHSTLTRFHLVAAIAVIAAGITLWLGSLASCLMVVAALALAIGLGVAIPQLRFFGPFVCQGNSKRRCVALTFDDGPDARSTPALLDLLQENRVAAAFFCVGENIEANRELTTRMAREGHLVENHSYGHNHLTNFFTVARLRSEMLRTQTAIAQATGVAPRLFRPPMGLSNPRVFRAARELGLAVIGWSVRSLDTQITSPERIVARIARQLRPGAIILLHDGNIPPERLVATVKMLLDTLRALDYEVIRLDKLLR
jgi:peptidoglycan/xylan/chitin deacetylase (PgdA/CDA1 family)